MTGGKRYRPDSADVATNGDSGRKNESDGSYSHHVHNMRNLSHGEKTGRRGSPLEGFSNQDFLRVVHSQVTYATQNPDEAMVPREMMAPTTQRPSSASFAT